MQIDDDKFPWNKIGKIMEWFAEQQSELYEKGEKEMEVLKDAAGKVKRIVVKEHCCPDCGSFKLESYKDEEHVYVKCESCGKVISAHRIKKLRPEIEEVKKAEESLLKTALPIFIWLSLFAVAFGFIARYITFQMGIF